MNVQSTIESKLSAGLDPHHLEVINESHRHNVPPGSESHFKVVLVSREFEGKSLLERHRLVHELLADEMRNDIHALALHTYTKEDWQSHQQNAPGSPPCHGGEKSA
jgi:BolA protein